MLDKGWKEKVVGLGFRAVRKRGERQRTAEHGGGSKEERKIPPRPKVGNAGEESVLRRLEWHLGKPPIFMGFYLRAVLLQVLPSGAGKIKVESLQS